MKYTVEDIVRRIEENKTVRYSFINNNQGGKIQEGIFNIIFFDACIRNEFEKSDLCVAYVDNGTIHYPTPISDIVKLY